MLARAYCSLMNHVIILRTDYIFPLSLSLQVNLYYVSFCLFSEICFQLMTDLYLTSLNFSTEILFLYFINNIIIRNCQSYNYLRTKVPVAQETFTLSFSFVIVIVSTYGDNSQDGG
jgi:hypothetical protein